MVLFNNWDTRAFFYALELICTHRGKYRQSVNIYIVMHTRPNEWKALFYKIKDCNSTLLLENAVPSGDTTNCLSHQLPPGYHPILICHTLMGNKYKFGKVPSEYQSGPFMPHHTMFTIMVPHSGLILLTVILSRASLHSIDSH